MGENLIRAWDSVNGERAFREPGPEESEKNVETSEMRAWNERFPWNGMSSERPADEPERGLRTRESGAWKVGGQENEKNVERSERQGLCECRRQVFAIGIIGMGPSGPELETVIKRDLA